MFVHSSLEDEGKTWVLLYLSINDVDTEQDHLFPASKRLATKATPLGTGVSSMSSTCA